MKNLDYIFKLRAQNKINSLIIKTSNWKTDQPFSLTKNIWIKNDYLSIFINFFDDEVTYGFLPQSSLLTNVSKDNIIHFMSFLQNRIPCKSISVRKMKKDIDDAINDYTEYCIFL